MAKLRTGHGGANGGSNWGRFCLLPSRGHLATSGDTLNCHNLRGATGIWWVGPRLLLTTLKHSGRSLQHRIIWTKMSTVPRLIGPEEGGMAAPREAETPETAVGGSWTNQRRVRSGRESNMGFWKLFSPHDFSYSLDSSLFYHEITNSICL